MRSILLLALVLLLLLLWLLLRLLIERYLHAHDRVASLRLLGAKNKTLRVV